MDAFVSVVDEPPQEVAVQKLVTDRLRECGFTAVRDLADAESSEVMTGFDTNPAVKAFMRRVLRAANSARSSAGSSQAVAAPSQQFSGPGSGILSLLGSDASAAALAKMYSGSIVDATKKLQDANLGKLPYALVPEQSVFQILHVEAEAARKANRPCFAYVDLTSRELLPCWIPQEAVGGKTGVIPEFLESESKQAVAALTAALRGATEGLRFFKSLGQWVPAYVRYAIAAVPMAHLTWVDVVAHMQIVSQIHESQRQLLGGTPQLAFLYDEFVRREVARRCERNDVTLDKESVFLTLDKEILEVAKTRLAAVLNLAGSAQASPVRNQDHLSEATREQTEAAAVLKQQAAESARALAQQERDFRSREQRVNGETGDRTSKSRKKALKSEEFFKTCREQEAARKAKGKGRGKGDKNKWGSDSGGSWKRARAGYY